MAVTQNETHVEESGFDQLLAAVDLRVEAFAVCEIGKHFSLTCDPFESVIVHFVLEGSGYLECEHGRLALTPGTIVVVPRRTAKKLRGIGPVLEECSAEAACPLTDGLVSFRALDGKADLLLGCALLPADSGTQSVFEHLERPLTSHANDPTIQALFAALSSELKRPRLGTRAFVSALMKQIIIVLFRSDLAEQAPMRSPSPDSRLARVVAAVLEQPEGGHTLETLAARAGMSRAQFSQKFSCAYNCSPKAFVQYVRLGSAARMLKESDLPIKSIAASVGYASRSHFSRAFLARYGLNPSSFRDISQLQGQAARPPSAGLAA